MPVAINTLHSSALPTELSREYNKEVVFRPETDFSSRLLQQNAPFRLCTHPSGGPSKLLPARRSRTADLRMPVAINTLQSSALPTELSREYNKEVVFRPETDFSSRLLQQNAPFRLCTHPSGGPSKLLPARRSRTADLRMPVAINTLQSSALPTELSREYNKEVVFRPETDFSSRLLQQNAPFRLCTHPSGGPSKLLPARRSRTADLRMPVAINTLQSSALPTELSREYNKEVVFRPETDFSSRLLQQNAPFRLCTHPSGGPSKLLPARRSRTADLRMPVAINTLQSSALPTELSREYNKEVVFRPETDFSSRLLQQNAPFRLCTHPSGGPSKLLPARRSRTADLRMPVAINTLQSSALPTELSREYNKEVVFRPETDFSSQLLQQNAPFRLCTHPSGGPSKVLPARRSRTADLRMPVAINTLQSSALPTELSREYNKEVVFRPETDFKSQLLQQNAPFRLCTHPSGGPSKLLPARRSRTADLRMPVAINTLQSSALPTELSREYNKEVVFRPETDFSSRLLQQNAPFRLCTHPSGGPSKLLPARRSRTADLRMPVAINTLQSSALPTELSREYNKEVVFRPETDFSSRLLQQNAPFRLCTHPSGGPSKLLPARRSRTADLRMPVAINTLQSSALPTELSREYNKEVVFRPETDFSSRLLQQNAPFRLCTHPSGGPSKLLPARRSRTADLRMPVAINTLQSSALPTELSREYNKEVVFRPETDFSSRLLQQNAPFRLCTHPSGGPSKLLPARRSRTADLRMPVAINTLQSSALPTELSREYNKEVVFRPETDFSSRLLQQNAPFRLCTHPSGGPSKLLPARRSRTADLRMPVAINTLQSSALPTELSRENNKNTFSGLKRIYRDLIEQQNVLFGFVLILQADRQNSFPRDGVEPPT